MSTYRTSKNPGVFELHGDHYDALTGAYIGGSGAHGHAETRTHKAPREARVWPAVQITSQAKPAAAPIAERQPVITRSTATKQAASRKTQHSKTLMRHVVKSPHRQSQQSHLVAEKAKQIATTTTKPAATKTRQVNTDILPPVKNPTKTGNASRSKQDSGALITVKVKTKAGSQPTTTAQLAKPTVAASGTTAAVRADQAASKAAAAATVSRSPQVSQHVPVTVKTAPKPIAVTTPTAVAAAPAVPPPASKMVAPATGSIPIKVAQVPVTEPPAHAHGANRAMVTGTSPAAVTGPRHELHQLKAAALADLRNLGDLDDPEPATQPDTAAEQDIFERALAIANSHEQKPKPDKMLLLKAAKRRKKLRRLTAISASVAVFLLLVGIVAFLNKSAIELQVASARAGFAATTPEYKPEGYSLNKVSYAPGTIATWYGKSDKTFSIIQKKSNWDSQTLLENFVATTNEDFEGYQVNGRTIYVYGNGKATWVNGGIWYQVQASDTLSNDQLLRVARSM